MPKPSTVPSELERAKLDFERDKVAIEERARRQTFVWTVSSGLLSALVAVAVAWIGSDGFSGGASKSEVAVAEERLVACRESLQRLASLSQLEGQSVESLAAAVQRHRQACDDALVDLISAARR